MSDDERRRFHRILFHAPAQLIADGKAWQVEILDCSLKGILVTTPSDWQPETGHPVELHWHLNTDEERSIQLQASIRHVSAETLGLHIEHIDLDSIMHLRRLVELNLADSHLLERDFEHIINTDAD